MVDGEQNYISSEMCQDPMLRTLIIREIQRSLDSALTFLEVLAVNLQFFYLRPL